MGAKASTDAVRKGSPQATLTGEFRVPKGHAALVTLENLGIPFEDTERGISILIRRQITEKGRSQSWVNDVVVTSQPLRELGATLIDVFGQHENQRLMNAHEHIGYLDGFLKDRSALSRVERSLGECVAIIRGIQEKLELSNRAKKITTISLFALKH